MHKELKKFLEKLYENYDNISCALLPENKTGRSLRSNFTKKELYEKLNTTNYQKWTTEKKFICICPNLLGDKSQRHIQKNIAQLNALFLDIDSGSLPATHLIEPHYIFKKENKYHLYWFIERVEANEKNILLYKKIQRRLLNYYGGDEQAKDLLRAMRLPYTPHNKTEKTLQYELDTCNEMERYNLEVIEKATDSQPEKTKNNTDANPLVTPHNENTFIDLIYNTYKHRAKKVFVGEGRSKELFFIGLNSYSWGLSLDSAIKLAEKINQDFFEPPEDSGIVKHQIESAYKYHKGEFAERQKNYITSTDKEQRRQSNAFRIDELLRDILERWVYVTDAERLTNLDTGFELRTQKQIENYLTNRIMSPVSFENILKKQLVTVCDKTNFRPDIADRVFLQNDEYYLNRYKGSDAERIEKPNKEAIKTFEAHIKYLTNSDYEFNAVLNYFSYILQNPGKKLPYALLIISQYEGIGKSLLEKLFRKIYPYNVQAVENADLDSSFNDYMIDSIFVFVHELAQGDKYSVMNKLKNKITETKLIVNQKYSAKFTIDNAANFIFFSNLLSAIHVSKRDRRLLTIYNEKEPMNDEYYDKLIEAIETHSNDLYTYFLNRDLSKFNPNKRPEITKGKMLLQEQSLSELAIFLNSCEFEAEGVFKHKLIWPTAILKYVEMYAPDVIRHKVGHKAVTQWLVDNGYKQFHIMKRMQGVPGDRINKVFWVKNSDDLTDDNMRAVLGPEVEGVESGKRNLF